MFDTFKRTKQYFNDKKENLKSISLSLGEAIEIVDYVTDYAKIYNHNRKTLNLFINTHSIIEILREHNRGKILLNRAINKQIMDTIPSIEDINKKLNTTDYTDIFKNSIIIVKRAIKSNMLKFPQYEIVANNITNNATTIHEKIVNTGTIAIEYLDKTKNYIIDNGSACNITDEICLEGF